MGDLIELLRLKKTSPEAFDEIVKDESKLAEYNVTSAELSHIKKIDPKALGTVVDSIDKALSRRALAGSQACQACADKARKMTDVPQI
jgi:hypothetical protein